MMNQVAFFISALVIIESCTKDSAKNPSLALSDRAFYDSCSNSNLGFYKNDSTSILAGNTGPHGTFKLRFNHLALQALTENGKLPANASMPEGSLVVKNVLSANKLSYYAYMYKKSGTWIWGEVFADKGVRFSVNKDPGICVNCHGQEANRDFLLTFKYY